MTAAKPKDAATAALRTRSEIIYPIPSQRSILRWIKFGVIKPARMPRGPGGYIGYSDVDVEALRALRGLQEVWNGVLPSTKATGVPREIIAAVWDAVHAGEVVIERRLGRTFVVNLYVRELAVWTP